MRFICVLKRHTDTQKRKVNEKEMCNFLIYLPSLLPYFFAYSSFSCNVFQLVNGGRFQDVAAGPCRSLRPVKQTLCWAPGLSGCVFFLHVCVVLWERCGSYVAFSHRGQGEMLCAWHPNCYLVDAAVFLSLPTPPSPPPLSLCVFSFLSLSVVFLYWASPLCFRHVSGPWPLDSLVFSPEAYLAPESHGSCDLSGNICQKTQRFVW